MLLRVEEETILEANSRQSFCIKAAVINCLVGPEARASDRSLEIDTLKRLLIDRHADKLSKKADSPDKEKIDPG